MTVSQLPGQVVYKGQLCVIFEFHFQGCPDHNSYIYIQSHFIAYYRLIYTQVNAGPSQFSKIHFNQCLN